MVAFSIVFVALGTQKPAGLIEAANHAKHFHEESSLYLITDRPRRWRSSFPGHVLHYSNKHRRQVVKDLEIRFPRRALIADGYWIKTIERLFALGALSDVLPADAPLVHFESDVLGFIHQDLLNELTRRCSRLAVPLQSETAGCASIVFSPNLEALGKGLEALETIFFNSKGWISDMDALAIAVREGKIDQLPTRFDDPWSAVISGKKVAALFDATALGMYLFGRDGYHDNGVVRTGFRHEDFEEDLEQLGWGLLDVSGERTAEKFAVFAKKGNRKFYLSNLHVHSKVMPGPCTPSNSRWERVLSEANGLCRRGTWRSPNSYNFRVPLSVSTLLLVSRIIGSQARTLLQKSR